MIHPTRTNLLKLRDKVESVTNSVAILKARRQALIKELLDSARPFVRSREAIKTEYGEALSELHLSMGHAGSEYVETLAAASERDIGVDVQARNVMGIHYREVSAYGPFVRSPVDRDYDYAASTPHLEESIHRFERIVESMLDIATFESKLKMLGREILNITRRSRVLEEKVLPQLNCQIRIIAQYIGEREREAYFRLKRFKQSGGVRPD